MYLLPGLGAISNLGQAVGMWRRRWWTRPTFRQHKDFLSSITRSPWPTWVDETVSPVYYGLLTWHKQLDTGDEGEEAPSRITVQLLQQLQHSELPARSTNPCKFPSFCQELENSSFLHSCWNFWSVCVLTLRSRVLSHTLVILLILQLVLCTNNRLLPCSSKQLPVYQLGVLKFRVRRPANSCFLWATTQTW